MTTAHKRKLDSDETFKRTVERKVDTAEEIKDEIWRTCTDADGKELALEVSSAGRVRNPSTRIVKVIRRDRLGYGSVTFADKSVRVARLVCRAFHGAAPIDKPFASHKDGDAANDAAVNLEWASRAQLCAKTDHSKGGPCNEVECETKSGEWKRFSSASEAVRATGVSRWMLDKCLFGRAVDAGGMRWRVVATHQPAEDIKGEVWRTIAAAGLSGYEVSDQGRVRNKKRQTILAQQRDGCGYLHVSFSTGGTRTHCPVHVLVAEAFLGRRASDKTQVDHINRRREDNRATNLRFVSARENTIFAIGRPVLRVDDGVRFPSLTEAARSLCPGGGRELVKNISSNIGQSIQRGIRCRGYRWAYAPATSVEKTTEKTEQS